MTDGRNCFVFVSHEKKKDTVVVGNAVSVAAPQPPSVSDYRSLCLPNGGGPKSAPHSPPLHRFCLAATKLQATQHHNTPHATLCNIFNGKCSRVRTDVGGLKNRFTTTVCNWDAFQDGGHVVVLFKRKTCCMGDGARGLRPYRHVVRTCGASIKPHTHQSIQIEHK